MHASYHATLRPSIFFNRTMTKLHDFGCGVSILGIQNSDDFRLKVGLKEI